MPAARNAATQREEIYVTVCYHFFAQFFCTFSIFCYRLLVFLMFFASFFCTEKTHPFQDFLHFSRMRSKGSRFTLGFWGLLRLWSQVFATVRNRAREDHMAVPMVSSAEVVIFGSFRRLVASFRVAGVALRDIQTCFVTSFCVAGAILLRCFFRRCVAFFVAGAALFLDASCCVFIASRTGRAASSGDKVQVPWRGIFSAMCWKWMEASHETFLRLKVFRN